MISVDEAIEHITAGVEPLEAERVPLECAHGRVLATDQMARVDQPPAAVSAMDGYAVRLADAHKAGISLRVIATAPAGHPFDAAVHEGGAVRIFTGSVVPEGADAILIQEDAESLGDRLTLRAPATPKHIRAAGLDFRKGDVLCTAGRKLSPRDLGLLAAGNIEAVEVRRQPVIAFASTGDELARPGDVQRPGGIVASSGYALAALIRGWGGEPLDLGILPDTLEALQRIPDQAARADAVVTLGGASVGEHDLVQRALVPKGLVIDFWKIAMRPGKPLVFGHLGKQPFLGLPGNPVSGYVCALLFLKPLIARLLGTDFEQPLDTARLAGTLRANDSRQDYLRARLIRRDREQWVEAFPIQDSSMQRALAAADALIVRAPRSPAVEAGDRVDIIRLAQN